MNDFPVRLETERGIATITLDSPANRNALSAAVRRGLATRLADAAGDDDVRAIVLTGAGPAFCAGADLKETAAALATGTVADPGAPGIPDLLRTLLDLPKPVIAKLNGPARAGGIGIVAACDLAFAPQDVSFAFTEVRIGVLPAMIAVVCATRMAPRPLSRYLLSGETFGATDAVAAGLLTAAWPAAEFEAALAGVLDGFRKGEPTAIGRTKTLLGELAGLDRDTAFAMTERLSMEFFASAAATEGRAAFLEKRAPKWAY